MRKVFGVFTLTVLLACSAHADGIIPNGNEPPPLEPDVVAVAPYESEATYTVYQPEVGAAPADSAADITFILISGVLSLF